MTAVTRDLDKRPVDWLKVASRAMERATTVDYLDWQQAQRG
jgi:hypothetical protein